MQIVHLLFDRCNATTWCYLLVIASKSLTASLRSSQDPPGRRTPFLLRNFSVASRVNVRHRSNDVRFELESCLVRLCGLSALLGSSSRYMNEQLVFCSGVSVVPRCRATAIVATFCTRRFLFFTRACAETQGVQLPWQWKKKEARREWVQEVLVG